MIQKTDTRPVLRHVAIKLVPFGANFACAHIEQGERPDGRAGPDQALVCRLCRNISMQPGTTYEKPKGPTGPEPRREMAAYLRKYVEEHAGE